MKAPIGANASSALVSTIIGTAGNVADVMQARALLDCPARDISTILRQPEVASATPIYRKKILFLSAKYALPQCQVLEQRK